MNTLFQIAVIVIACWMVIEVATAVYIYRNRATLIPRIRTGLRHLLGLDSDRFVAQTEREAMVRKINYIGRHVQFERQELRKLGVLTDDIKTSSPANVLPLRSDN